MVTYPFDYIIMTLTTTIQGQFWVNCVFYINYKHYIVPCAREFLPSVKFFFWSIVLITFATAICNTVMKKMCVIRHKRDKIGPSYLFSEHVVAYPLYCYSIIFLKQCLVGNIQIFTKIVRQLLFLRNHLR